MHVKKSLVYFADAEADAKYVLKYTRALKAAGPIGTKLLDQQTQLGVAQKAGTVIMQIGGGATIDPINAQILEEQKKSNVLLEQSLAGGRPPKKGA